MKAPRRARTRGLRRRETAAPPPARAAAAWGWLAHPAVVPALLVLVALLMQARAVRLPFFADDFLFLDAVRGHRLLELFRIADPIGNFWRPFSRQAWFALLSHLGGESPLPFHALNVILFATSVALFHGIARRLAGARAAAVAAALLALTYAADVPVRWASGCQDLLATAGALAALDLHLRRRPAWAAAALALALLSKETVVFTCAIAVLLDRDAVGWPARLKRAWPLVAVTALWAVARLARAHGADLPTFAVRADTPLAVAAHLLQVTLGAEWRAGDPAHLFRVVPALLPLAVAVGALALAWRRPATVAAASGRNADLAAIGWALLGSAPIMAVAPIWSAYFYLFALCGAFLLAGRWIARLPLAPAIALVALLAWGGESARRLDEFATVPGAWTSASHVNRHYLDRAMGRVEVCLKALYAQHPTFPRGSRIYFAGAPSFAAWQVGDGPLVRWAYRDTTLRSYFMTAFDGRRSGPTYLLEFLGERLVDHTGEPGFLDRLFYTALCEERFDDARRLMAGHLAEAPRDQGTLYLLALVEARAGRADTALALMRRAGLALALDVEPELAAARTALARRDTLAAVAHAERAVAARPLDPRPHELLSDLMLLRAPDTWTPAEPFAVVALAPRDPEAWWRWALVQTSSQCYEEASRSLARYREMAGPAKAGEPRVRVLEEFLASHREGGERFREMVREDARGSTFAR